MNSCETCIHFEVCSKKEKFEKMMNEIKYIKLSNGEFLLDTKDIKANIGCKHYTMNYEIVCAKGGIIEVGK